MILINFSKYFSVTQSKVAPGIAGIDKVVVKMSHNITGKL